MPTTEEMLETIDAKLSVVLKVVVDLQAQVRPSGFASSPSDLEAHAATLPAAQPPAPAGSPAGLDEIAKLLALSLVRKRDVEDAIVRLDAAGFQHARIAELLGVKRGRVEGALERAGRRSR
jgi:hypothetical protein